MVCSQSSEFRCSNDCGNPLACGNHTCRKTCHFVTIPRLVAGEEVYVMRVVPPPPEVVEVEEPTSAPEGAWGKYGSSLPPEKCTSNGAAEGALTAPDNVKVVDSCEQCRLPCQKVTVSFIVVVWSSLQSLLIPFCVCLQKRGLRCSHPCTQRCHVGPCKPCKAVLKRACHCEALVQSFDCTTFNSVSDAARVKLLSCGGPCHRYF